MLKKFFLIVTIFTLLCPNVYAMKTVSYENGKRVYHDVLPRSAYSPAHSSRRIYVYDENGRKIRSYSRNANGRTYVYDANGKRIGSLSSGANGRTYVYDGNGNRIRTYSDGSRINRYNHPRVTSRPGGIQHYSINTVRGINHYPMVR